LKVVVEILPKYLANIGGRAFTVVETRSYTTTQMEETNATTKQHFVQNSSFLLVNLLIEELSPAPGAKRDHAQQHKWKRQTPRPSTLC